MLSVNARYSSRPLCGSQLGCLFCFFGTYDAAARTRSPILLGAGIASIALLIRFAGQKSRRAIAAHIRYDHLIAGRRQQRGQSTI